MATISLITKAKDKRITAGRYSRAFLIYPCPLPPLKTVAKLRGMAPGQVLEVLGTNPVGNKVAPWVAQKLGDQLLGLIEDDGFHRFYFRKSA